tara:strand:- start:10932 stop:11213 length:282 start_codon:yes stop_codon:yes gene_type:complete
MEWKPRKSDIEWTRKHIASISEGGKWAIPIANNSVITFYHSDKTYDCINRSNGLEGDYVIMQTLSVLKILGYSARSIIKDFRPIDRKFQEDNA